MKNEKKGGQAEERLFTYETLAENSNKKLLVRAASSQDLKTIIKLESLAWNESQRASDETLSTRFRFHRQGFFIAQDLVTGQPYGFIFIIPILHFEEDAKHVWEKYAELAAQPSPSEKSLYYYGISMAVAPGSPAGIGSSVMRGAIEWCKQSGARKFAWGGRIANFQAANKKGISIQEYFAGILDGSVREELAGVGLNAGGRLVRPMPEYYDDPESLNFGLLIVHDLKS